MVWFYGISAIVGYLMPNPLYAHTYIKYIRFGWVLLHINYCGLFNAKSSLYIYIYIGWNAEIVVLKKTALQLYLKTFIEKINSGNLIM